MSAARVSGGVLAYRFDAHGALEVLIAHPGGPFWRNRDEGAWTIPKGELDPGEDPAAAALREFEEETGVALGRGADLIPLGSVTQKAGKVVHAWAAHADVDPDAVTSNEIEIEWPPRSGRRIAIPEIDRVAWVHREEASRLLNPALVELVSRLEALLGT